MHEPSDAGLRIPLDGDSKASVQETQGDICMAINFRRRRPENERPVVDGPLATAELQPDRVATQSECNRPRGGVIAQFRAEPVTDVAQADERRALGGHEVKWSGLAFAVGERGGRNEDGNRDDRDEAACPHAGSHGGGPGSWEAFLARKKETLGAAP